MMGRRIRELIPILEPALLADAVSTTGLAFVAKSAGFLVPIFIASRFGVSAGTDAFFFAFGAISFLAGVFGPVVEVVVPFVSEERGPGDSRDRFLSGLLSTGTVVVVLVIAVFFLVLIPVLPLATRFGPDGVALVVRLALETSPLAVLLLWTSILSGHLNAHKAFSVPALSPAARAGVNLGCIAALSGRLGVHALPLGYVAGEIVRVLALGLAVRRRAPFRFRPTFRVDARLADFYRASAYPVVGMVWVLANPIVDSAMASWLAPGSVSVLRYAENLYWIPFSLFTGGLVTVVLAHWSQRYHGGGRDGFERDVGRSSWGVFWLAVPVAAILAVASRPIAGLLLAHGSFEQARLGEVAITWTCFLAGLPAHAMAQLTIKALLVLRKTKVLLTCGVYALLLNAVLNLALMRSWGVAGIAFATSLTSVASTLYLARALRVAFAEAAASSRGNDALVAN